VITSILLLISQLRSVMVTVSVTSVGVGDSDGDGVVDECR